MPNSIVARFGFLAVLAIGMGQQPAPAFAAPTATVTYTADASDFANPERGFSQADGDPTIARGKSLSLVHVYFRLDDYRAAPLPAKYLDQVRKTFANARKAGVKVVPRFSYNFPDGEPYGPEDADAPLDRVLGHLDQLAPVLQDNSDVIAFMEAGFIGAWGEWHHSQNGLDTVEAERTVLDKILSVLPASRAVAVRTPHHKTDILDRMAPTRPAEAFTGGAVARIGHHNDCFLASADDWGTYVPNDPDSIRAQKRYLAADSRYVPQGGETCNAGPDAERYISCDNALDSLAAQHWSQLNADYQPQVLDGWKKGGCYDEVAKRLGYRLRLVQATMQTTARSGGLLQGAIQLNNDGFAAPFNPRGLELVLRERSSGATTVLALADDPRRWGAGETHTITVKARLADHLAAGTYELLLNLPDPAPRLHDRPAYAIHLANVGVWEPATGYNRLNLTVRVK